MLMYYYGVPLSCVTSAPSSICIIYSRCTTRSTFVDCNATVFGSAERWTHTADAFESNIRLVRTDAVNDNKKVWLARSSTCVDIDGADHKDDDRIGQRQTITIIQNIYICFWLTDNDDKWMSVRDQTIRMTKVIIDDERVKGGGGGGVNQHTQYPYIKYTTTI